MLRVGADERKITPATGVDLAGFALREGPSEGIHDDLWCRVVVLDDGETRVALAALDLLRLDFELDAAIRREVSETGELDPAHVLLNCSHTHAGPATSSLGGTGVANQDYVSRLPSLIAAAVRDATSDLARCRLSYGEAPVRIGINRREATAEGSLRIGRNPAGLTDTRMRVVRADTDEASPAVIVFNTACHGTTLKEDNKSVSAEWMGAAASLLRKTAVGDARPVFLQGCCGQINADAESRFEEVDRLGAEAAEAVVAAACQSQPFEGVPLGGKLERIGLPVADAPPADRAQADLREAEEAAEQARRDGLPPYRIRAQESLVAYTRRMLERSQRGAERETVPFAVQVVRIGELAIVGLSGEVFFEFAQRIAAESPFRHTLVLGYSNGCTCYVPTEEAFVEGGYEADDSFRWYGIPPLMPHAGEVMTQAAARMLADLHQGTRP